MKFISSLLFVSICIIISTFSLFSADHVPTWLRYKDPHTWFRYIMTVYHECFEHKPKEESENRPVVIHHASAYNQVSPLSYPVNRPRENRSLPGISNHQPIRVRRTAPERPVRAPAEEEVESVFHYKKVPFTLAKLLIFDWLVAKEFNIWGTSLSFRKIISTLALPITFPSKWLLVRTGEDNNNNSLGRFCYTMIKFYCQDMAIGGACYNALYYMLTKLQYYTSAKFFSFLHQRNRAHNPFVFNRM